MVIESGTPGSISLRAEFERDEVASVWFGTLSIGIGDCSYASREPELLNSSFVTIASWLTRESDAAVFEAVEHFSARQALIAALLTSCSYSFAEVPKVRNGLHPWLSECLEAPFGLALGLDKAILILRSGDAVRACGARICDGNPFATLEDVSETRLKFDDLRQITQDFVSRVPPVSGISLLP
jgi:hypothetical protein